MTYLTLLYPEDESNNESEVFFNLKVAKMKGEPFIGATRKPFLDELDDFGEAANDEMYDAPFWHV